MTNLDRRPRYFYLRPVAAGIGLMDGLQEHWRRASRGTLHISPTITDGGVLLGYGTILVHRSREGYELDGDAERFLCLLSIPQRRPQPPTALDYLRRALASWQRGDKALAHILLAFARLPRIDSIEEAWCLHQAEGLLDLGMAPLALAKELGLDLKPPRVSKAYNPNKLRNPKHDARASGEWTKDPVASGAIAFAPAPAPGPMPAAPKPPPAPAQVPIALPAPALAPSAIAPSLVDALGAEALEWLSAFAGTLALPAAVFGAVFVPSPNGGGVAEGEVPDRPGISYRLDGDTGTLRLSLDSDPDPGNALVATLGADGIYRDVDTRVPIARFLDGRAVLIDPARARTVSSIGAIDDGTDDDGPKLCPDPSKDKGGGRKLFDILYEQWVRDFVNPQRKPQLPPGMAFSLPADTKSGWVHYDDCREATGAMIEAKGNYAGMLRSESGRRILAQQWIGQAKRQISGANGRSIEWYFHDPAAAAFARKLFSDAGYDKSIKTFVLPFPGGVPKFNPRIK